MLTVNMKHLTWFVMGAIAEYERQTGAMIHNKDRYLSHTMGLVMSYIRSGNTDGTWSDFQCVLAHEAANVFGKKQWQYDAIVGKYNDTKALLKGDPTDAACLGVGRSEEELFNSIRNLCNL